MNQFSHQDYYVARAATSRAMAERAAHPKAAAVHAELATRYEGLAHSRRPDLQHDDERSGDQS